MYLYFIVITAYQEYSDPLVEVGKTSIFVPRPSKISSKADMQEILDEYRACPAAISGSKRVLITHISFLHEI